MAEHNLAVNTADTQIRCIAVAVSHNTCKTIVITTLS